MVSPPQKETNSILYTTLTYSNALMWFFGKHHRASNVKLQVHLLSASTNQCWYFTWLSHNSEVGCHYFQRPTGFLQYFDTVGLVIWPVKIVPEMTYYVSSGTLNPTQSHSLPLLSTRPIVTLPAIECHCPWPVPNYAARWQVHRCK